MTLRVPTCHGSTVCGMHSIQGEASLLLTQRGLRLVRSVAGLSPRHWHQLRALTRAKDRLSE